MYIYGDRSRERLETCHPALRAVMTRALEISPFDITIVCGWRGEADQNKAYSEGKSKARWGQSKHNHMKDGKPLSLAVDAAPWVNGTIPWDDRVSFAVLAGVVFAAAIERGVVIRWGGNWSPSWSPSLNKFPDMPHFELMDAV
jgi:peptidoglycan L-alanyl-D-glutamate endopeptidase CwlK